VGDGQKWFMNRKKRKKEKNTLQWKRSSFEQSGGPKVERPKRVEFQPPAGMKESKQEVCYQLEIYQRRLEKARRNVEVFGVVVGVSFWVWFCESLRKEKGGVNERLMWKSFREGSRVGPTQLSVSKKRGYHGNCHRRCA